MSPESPTALQEIVLDGLSCLGASAREVARGVWQVDLPPGVRRHFGSVKELRLVIDYDVWQQDRSTTLVAAGSRFLEELEAALVPPAAPDSELWGGELLPDGGVVERWFERVRVVNAVLSTADSGSSTRFEELHLLVFEADVPGPPPTTEVVPMVWASEEARFLAPAEVARVNDQHWYPHREVAAFVESHTKPRATGVRTAREMAEGELARRLAPLLDQQYRQRKKDLDKEQERLDLDLSARKADAAHARNARDAETDEQLKAEFDRRTKLLSERANATAQVALRAHLILHRGKVDYVARLKRQDDQVVSAPLPQVAGRIRQDLCSWCGDVQHEYLAEPGLETGLACTNCAAACRAEHCGGLVRRRVPDACASCEAPRYCSAHHSTCGFCDAAPCIEHTLRCDETSCDSNLCPKHARKLDEQTHLCDRHAAVCEVGGEVVRRADAFECPVTTHWVCAEHGVRPADDERVLHPKGVVTCSTTGEITARDRAGICAHDKQWHREPLLRTSEATQDLLCPEHRGAVDRPEGWEVESSRRILCPATNLTVDRSVTAKCSVSGAICFIEALLRCPVSKKLLRPSAAVVLPGDGRALHPSAVVVCATTGDQLALDHVVYCQTGELPHRRELMAKSSATGRHLCASHRVLVDRPEGWTVELDRCVQCPESGLVIDMSRAATCSASSELCFEEVLITCAVTGRKLRPSKVVVVPGDDRILHPSAVVHSVLSGRAVAEDRAVWDHVSFDVPRPLLSDEAATCDLSGQRAARSLLVTAACCGRAVAPKFARPSVLSGLMVCDDHLAVCVSDGGQVLQSESTTCAVTGRVVCTDHAVTAACCGRAVAPKVARPSVLSGLMVCDDHLAVCVLHGGPILQSESKTCALTDRVVCTDHAVVTECGRTVGVDRVFEVRPGLWGCDEHYGICEATTHPSLRTGLSACSHCGQQVCAAHQFAGCQHGSACREHFERCAESDCRELVCTVHGRADLGGRHLCEAHAHSCGTCAGWVSVSETRICACHGRAIHDQHLEPDPYESTQLYCEGSMVQCSRCGLHSPGDPAHAQCTACRDPQRLNERPDAHDDFTTFVRPFLGRFGLRLRTWVSGGPDQVLFEVQLLTTETRLFLVDRTKQDVTVL